MVSESPIERVVCGSGESLPCSGELAGGKLFASDHRRGGALSYFKIDSDTLAIYGRMSLAMKLFMIAKEGELARQQKKITAANCNSAVGDGKKSVGHDSVQNEGPTMGTESDAECAALQPVPLDGVCSKETELSVVMNENGRTLEQWLRAHPGVVGDIGRPGAREACIRVRKYLHTDLGEIFWKSNEGASGPAELVHGIQVFGGQDVAHAYRNCIDELRQSINNLAKLNKWFFWYKNTCRNDKKRT